MVPTMILTMLRPVLPYLAAAVAVLMVVLYIVVLRHDVTAARHQNIVLAEDNQANVAAIAAYKAEALKWSVAVAAIDARGVDRSRSVTRITDRIGAAPRGDDGPVAPVLARALGDLRALQEGGR